MRDAMTVEAQLDEIVFGVRAATRYRQDVVSGQEEVYPLIPGYVSERGAGPPTAYLAAVAGASLVAIANARVALGRFLLHLSAPNSAKNFP